MNCNWTNKTSRRDAAQQQSKVSRNIDLVYGGGSIGLMGLVSQAVHDGGRHVIGVIPKTLMPRELTGQTVGEVKAVADMHQRKAEMAKHSDAFIALPERHVGWELDASSQRWADKKSHLGNEWKKPFAGSSHAKGIVLEKM
ncbi:hypothetical protein QQ045_003430 [Rhodiola kirilowii]